MTAQLFENLVSRLDATDRTKRLVITPLLDRKTQVGPGTIDLRLGTDFLEVSRERTPSIDPFEVDRATSGGSRRSQVALGDKFSIHPGQFILGATLEFIVLPPDLVGQVVSRSSWGRLGLLVATAVVVQPGFCGVLTLELVNAGSVPIVLRPGLRIAQLQLWSAERPTEVAYGRAAKYDAPLGPQSNRLVAEISERTKLEAIGNAMHARHKVGVAD